jgi:hypothetical protein
MQTDQYKFDLTQLAKFCVGFAQVYSIPNNSLEHYNKTFNKYPIKHGDARIIYPLKFCDESEIYKNENALKKKIQEYPKGKPFSFGNIKFINDARIEERDILIKKSSDIKVLLNLEIEKAESLSNKMHEIQNECNAKESVICKLRRKIEELEQQNDSRKLEFENTYKQLESKYISDLKKKEFLIEHLERKLHRPKTIYEIVDWVNETFKGKLTFNRRAIELIRNTTPDQIEIDLLCDAIECIACEWRDRHMGKIKDHEMIDIMSAKYDRPFEIVPSGFNNLQQYSKEYKAKILDAQTGTMREKLLDWHLKVGKNKNPLRVYFLFDDVNKEVVIGSLPKHLPICSIES